MKCKKILLKIVTIIFILQLIILPTVSQAGVWGDGFSWATNFLQKGQRGVTNSSFSENDLVTSSNNIYYVLLQVGIVLAVIIGGILGIKFMTASVEDKAKIKESMIPYVIGCVIIFGAFAIWKIAVDILQSIA